MDEQQQERRAESGQGAGGPPLSPRGEHDDLFASLYNELQALARVIFRDQSPAHTLQPTALVHEAYLKIAAAATPAAVNDREHALALGATAMRQLLINHANAANAQKRGGKGRKRLTLTGIASSADRDTLDMLALAEALRELEKLNERQCRVIECRYLGGLSVAETARVLGVSDRTVELDARVARLWLLSRLDELDGNDA